MLAELSRRLQPAVLCEGETTIADRCNPKATLLTGSFSYDRMTGLLREVPPLSHTSSLSWSSYRRSYVGNAVEPVVAGIRVGSFVSTHSLELNYADANARLEGRRCVVTGYVCGRWKVQPIGEDVWGELLEELEDIDLQTVSFDMWAALCRPCIQHSTEQPLVVNSRHLKLLYASPPGFEYSVVAPTFEPLTGDQRGRLSADRGRMRREMRDELRRHILSDLLEAGDAAKQSLKLLVVAAPAVYEDWIYQIFDLHYPRDVRTAPGGLTGQHLIVGLDWDTMWRETWASIIGVISRFEGIATNVDWRNEVLVDFAREWVAARCQRADRPFTEIAAPEPHVT